MERRIPKLDIYLTGQNIKHIMHSRGMTVKKIQEYLGLQTPQSIYHWFYGKNLPTVDNLYSLSTLFMMPMDDIVRGNSNEIISQEIEDTLLRSLIYCYRIKMELRQQLLK